MAVGQYTDGARWLLIAAGAALAGPALAAALVERRRGRSMRSELAICVGAVMTTTQAVGLLSGLAGWVVGLSGLATIVYGIRVAEE